jgi:hypothetical protein
VSNSHKVITAFIVMLSSDFFHSVFNFTDISIVVMTTGSVELWEVEGAVDDRIIVPNHTHER